MAESNGRVRPPTAAELGIGVAHGLPSTVRADRDNWTVTPYNRWTFQRVSQFAETSNVPCAEQARPLPVSLQDLSSLEFLDSEGSETSVAEMLDDTWTDGFLVMHRGVIVAEQYCNGMGIDTQHLLMSCSKSFTSTLASIFIDSGLLDLDTAIASYLPELKESGFADATLQQCLDMRVGVRFDENYDDLGADWTDLEIATGWRPFPEGYEGPRDMLAFAGRLQKERQHGGHFHYQSILTDVVGCALERVTGQGFSELFADHIWRPLGAQRDLVTMVDSGGHAVFEGGFNVCLRDFARFGQLICDRGCWDGQQLIPESWVDQCRFAGPELVAAFAGSEYALAMPGAAYHNKWWVWDPQRGVLMALGIHGQTVYIDPEKEVVIAKFSSQPSPVDIRMTLDQLRSFEAIANELDA